MERQKPIILIVDDEPGVLAVVRLSLGTQGNRYELVEATTAADAVRMATQHQPDLALLDIGLPDQDGFSVCRAIKQMPATDGTTVIMLTARNQPTDRQQAAEAGADAYLAKPFSPRELIAIVADKLADRYPA